MRIVVLLLILLTTCKSTFVGKDRSKICWEENRPLTWKDFKGKVPKKTERAAITHVHFHYEIISKNSIAVYNCMDKNKSWSIKRYQSPRILAHEQYHFNISEIYARRMTREMAKIDVPTIPKTKAVFDEWWGKYKAEQDLYDKETSHSNNEEEQAKWQAKIDRELKELEAYKEKIAYLNQ